MTRLLLSLALLSTSIAAAWLTVRDVDALPKMWRRLKLNPATKALRAASRLVNHACFRGSEATKTETSGFKVRSRGCVEAATAFSITLAIFIIAGLVWLFRIEAA